MFCIRSSLHWTKFRIRKKGQKTACLLACKIARSRREERYFLTSRAHKCSFDGKGRRRNCYTFFCHSGVFLYFSFFSFFRLFANILTSYDIFSPLSVLARVSRRFTQCVHVLVNHPWDPFSNIYPILSSAKKERMMQFVNQYRNICIALAFMK